MRFCTWTTNSFRKVHIFCFKTLQTVKRCKKKSCFPAHTINKEKLSPNFKNSSFFYYVTIFMHNSTSRGSAHPPFGSYVVEFTSFSWKTKESGNSFSLAIICCSRIICHRSGSQSSLNSCNPLWKIEKYQIRTDKSATVLPPVKFGDSGSVCKCRQEVSRKTHLTRMK